MIFVGFSELRSKSVSSEISTCGGTEKAQTKRPAVFFSCWTCEAVFITSVSVENEYTCVTSYSERCFAKGTKPLCVCLSLSRSLSLPISLSLYLSQSLSLSISLSLSLSISIPPNLPQSLSLSISISLYLSQSLSLSISISLNLYRSYL